MQSIHTLALFLTVFALCFVGCANNNSSNTSKEDAPDTAAQTLSDLSDCIAHFVEDTHCEKTRIGKASPIATRPPRNFKGSVAFFMEALKTGNIDQAGMMSSEYGLVSFLQMDIDEVSSYQASNFQVNDVIGTALIDINDLGSPRTFYFNLMNGVWTFVGSDYWNA